MRILPKAFSFLDAYHQQIKALPGYTPVQERTLRAMIEVNRRGA